MNERLQAFRDLVHEGIRIAQQNDGGKRYEGRIFFSTGCPGVYDTGDKVTHKLELHCYLLGPSRAYLWTDHDEAELFAKASKDVQRWVDQERARAADDDDLLEELERAEDGASYETLPYVGAIDVKIGEGGELVEVRCG